MLLSELRKQNFRAFSALLRALNKDFGFGKDHEFYNMSVKDCLELYSDNDLLKLRNFGQKSLDYLKSVA